ncbi:MAG TPA: Ig-like domain-containing protein, partial [Candidatus Thermoplasmatota archaeon]|nr:Ig-like domain-containing protein [Candidatus Thermoplasmatota archaeon]
LVDWVTHVGSVTFVAQASDACTTIDRVEWYVDDLLVETDFAAPYAFTYDPHRFWPAFKHVTARAVDANGNAGSACAHVVNTGWTGPHHLPIVGAGPPDGWRDTLTPERLGHAVAGDAHCADDRVDELVPGALHPFAPPRAVDDAWDGVRNATREG